MFSYLLFTVVTLFSTVHGKYFFFADDLTYSLNVGLVDSTGTVSSPDVVDNGSKKAHDQWDPAPFSDLSTYSSPEVTFALWINQLSGAKTTYEVDVAVSFTNPVNPKVDTNYAKCTAPPLVTPTSGTLSQLTGDAVNASALRITFDPQQSCTQPGQSMVYITVTTPGKTDPLVSLYFVTTRGNPLNIGSTVGGADISSQGIVTDTWDPKHLSDGSCTETQCVLFHDKSNVLSIDFYLSIPADRKQNTINPLVLGNQDGVTLPGTVENRQAVSCTTRTKDGTVKIDKACQANVLPLATLPPTSGGVWDQQGTVDAGLDFSLHIEYVCETNGYVDLLVEIPLKSGFAPVSFAWRKACQRSPGLAIATAFAAVLADPDVAQDGLIRPEWDVKNSSIVDRDGDAGDPVLAKRAFYFYVNKAGVNVQAATFKAVTSSSTDYPVKGATSLVCSPSPVWKVVTNFDAQTNLCTGPQNVCTWGPIAVTGLTPSQPLQPGAPPIRAEFDYSSCSGQGTVLLSFEMKFGDFDFVQVGWYKYKGTPPGLTMGCESGCPTSASNSSTSAPIAVNGQVQDPWTSEYGPDIDNRILQSSWSIGADATISAYDFAISNIVATAGSEACHLDFSGELGNRFIKGQWSGVQNFQPGQTMSLGMVYICTPGQNGKDTFTLKVQFTNYKSITIVFTKHSQYSSKIYIGTSNNDPTHEENVNAEGSPGKAWKTPQEGCLDPILKNRQTDCTLDERGKDTRSFYISYKNTLSAPGHAVIPAPTTVLDPSKQFPGAHSSYFFTYNSTDMVGCFPFWEVTQAAKGANKGILNKHDFVKLKSATISADTAPFVLTVDYNCSKGFSKCSENGDCASLFTGFVPINSNGCDAANPHAIAPCSYPMFRWIKTVAPIQPAGLNVNWYPYPLGGNVTWEVPDSGDGADSSENQRIRLYNITLQNVETKEKKEYLLHVNNGSSFESDEEFDEFDSKYRQPLGAKLLFSLHNMTGDTYQLWMNVTNEAGLSTLVHRLVQPGTPTPDNALGPLAIAVIAVTCGVLFVVGACLMYHFCIKNGGKKNSSNNQEFLPAHNNVQSNMSPTMAPNNPMSNVLANEDPYGSSDQYQPPPSQNDADADALMQKLLA